MRTAPLVRENPRRAPVNPIRIVLMNLHPKLRDIIVDAVTDEPDLEIAEREFQQDDDLEELDADVVIAGATDPGDLAVPSQLLSLAPRIRVLMVALSGLTAAMYELRPTRTSSFFDVTQAALIAEIRRHAHAR